MELRDVTRRVDDVDSARRRGVAKAERRAPHLASLGDAGVGVLRRERVQSQDAIGGGTLAGANLSDENEGNVVSRGGLAWAAQLTVVVDTAATHSQTELQDLAPGVPDEHMAHIHSGAPKLNKDCSNWLTGTRGRKKISASPSHLK